jgi:hypothetical protein
MNKDSEVIILAQDRIKLTKDQRNLITLALNKQLPPEDAEFLESIQQSKHKIVDPYKKINHFYIKKYGSIFGRIYLSAITGGEEACTDTIYAIEKSNALERVRKKRSVRKYI